MTFVIINDVPIRCTGERRARTRQDLSEMATMMGNTFLRVHRSFLVNIGRITAYNAEGIFVGEHHIPVGTNYKKFVACIITNGHLLDVIPEEALISFAFPA